MESELTAALKDLTEVLKAKQATQAAFDEQVMTELRELNTHLRHLVDRLAPRDY